MRKFYLPILIAILFICSCGGNQTTTNTTPKPSTTPTTSTAAPENGKFIKGEFEEGHALTLLYGSFDPRQQLIPWTPTKEEAEKLDVEPGTKVFTKLLAAKKFTEKGKERIYLVTTTVPEGADCHACPAAIGVLTFTHNGDRWDLNLADKVVTRMGSYGEAPTPALLKVGPEKYVLSFSPGDLGQGITSNSEILIGEINNKLGMLLELHDIAGDNGGNCGDDLGPCWEFTSKFDYLPGKNPDFYDIKVTYSGTKWSETEDKKVEPNNKVQTFTLVKDKYEEVGAAKVAEK